MVHTDEVRTLAMAKQGSPSVANRSLHDIIIFTSRSMGSSGLVEPLNWHSGAERQEIRAIRCEVPLRRG
ncbi:hypothetical protein HS7_20940 [Sulfolobales archaeon HS-7]|nr:hypothetical protein HS7_20940 [Sulfolobales archaeon HS-7]